MPNKIVFEDFAPGARENAIVGDNTTQLKHQVTQNGVTVETDIYGRYVENGVTHYWIFEKNTPYHCATFDDGGIDLSTSAVFYADGDGVGFVSSAISDAGGIFNINALPVLEIVFPQNMRFSGSGITLYFNTHYCKRLKVQYFANGTEIAPVDGNAFYDVNGLVAFLPRRAESYDRILITFYETQSPYQRAMVSMVTFGTTHEITDLHSLEYHKKIAFDCSDVSAGTLDTVFESSEDLAFYRNQKIKVYHSDSVDGAYSLIGEYWISNAEKQTRTLYSVTAEDVFGYMDRKQSIPFFSADNWYVLTNGYIFAQIANIVGYQPVFNNVSASTLIRGSCASTSIRVLLAEMCFSTQNVAYVNDSGNIALRSIVNTVSKTIGSEDILGTAEFTQEDRKDAVTAKFTRYNGGANNINTVYIGTIPMTGVTVKTDYPIFSGPDILKIQEGQDIGESVTFNYTYPPIYNKIVVSKNVSPFGYTISATDEEYEEDEVHVQLRQYKATDFDVSYSASQINGNEIAEKNYGKKAFYTPSIETTISDLCERLNKVKGKVKAAYIGDDLVLGQYVSIETKHSGTLKGTVTEITGDVGYTKTIQNVVITVWE